MRALLQILALSAFAVAQPLFSVMQRHSTFLVAHHVGRSDVVLLALVLGFGVALIPGVIYLGGRLLGPRSATGVLLALEVMLVALAVSPWVRRGAWFGGLLGWLGPIACGVLLVAAVRRWRLASNFLTTLAVAALLFPLLFLTQRPVVDLWRSAPELPKPAKLARHETPIVLIVLDELPVASLLDSGGAIDEELFPSFARLAQSSVFYRNATTASEMTSGALASLLTGRYPRRPASPPRLENYPENLFTLLRASHHLRILEGSSRMSPLVGGSHRERASVGVRARALLSDLGIVYLHLVTPRHLATRLPPVDQAWRGFTRSDRAWRPGVARRVTLSGEDDEAFDWYNPEDGWRRFIGGFEAAPITTLHYLHRILPHVPWRRLPDGHSYRSPQDVMRADEWIGSEWQVAQALQRHLLQVGYVDSLLGALLDELDRLDLFDRSLMIVVADHGASFDRELPRRRLPTGDTSSLPDIAGVPLFVKYPESRSGRVDDRPAQSVDILPTILSVLGAAPREPLDGRTLDDRSVSYGPGLSRERWLYPDSDRTTLTEPIPLGSASLLAGSRVRELKGRVFHRPGWSGVYDLGRPAEVPPVRGRRLTTELDQTVALGQVDFRRQGLPVWISGRLVEDPDQPEELHVSRVGLYLNGRYAAQTEVLADRRFGALVTPESLRQGANSVEVFALGPQAGDRF